MTADYHYLGTWYLSLLQEAIILTLEKWGLQGSEVSEHLKFP